MRNDIARFQESAKAYLSQRQAEGLTVAVDELVDAQRARHEARNAAVDAGRRLAELLDARGEDSTLLRAWVLAIDGLGGGRAAEHADTIWKEWRPLAAWLERLANQRPTGPPTSDAVRALLRLFAGGVADERFERAGRVVSDPDLTADEKLHRIDELMPVPATASAAQLGDLLRVSKAAIQKTNWYKKCRAGQRAVDAERRRRKHE